MPLPPISGASRPPCTPGRGIYKNCLAPTNQQSTYRYTTLPDKNYMECNKDEAERCKDLGNQFLQQGDTAKAHKFFNKSKSLFPLPGIDELIAKTISTQQQQQKQKSPTHAPPPKQEEAPEPPPPPNYTAEELEIVQTIVCSKNHYDTLKVSATCMIDEIKKQYRKVRSVYTCNTHSVAVSSAASPG